MAVSIALSVNYAECRKKPIMLSVLMLSAIVLSVVMLSAIMQSVVMPKNKSLQMLEILPYRGQYYKTFHSRNLSLFQ
jgi:hypothetical protein